VELLSILALLRRHAIAAALGGVLAVIVALAGLGALPFGPSARAEERSAVAEARLLIDNPSPLVANLRSPTSSITTQATLLAALLANDRNSAAIAREAGVPVGMLDVPGAALVEQSIPTPLAAKTSVATAVGSAPYVVSARAEPTLPIVTLTVTAPDVPAARRLTEAGAVVLAQVSAARAPEPQSALAVDILGPVRAREVVEAGPGPAMAIAAALAAFVACVATGAAASGLVRRVRGRPSAEGERAPPTQPWSDPQGSPAQPVDVPPGAMRGARGDEQRDPLGTTRADASSDLEASPFA
jgi:hypothetical protein